MTPVYRRRQRHKLLVDVLLVAMWFVCFAGVIKLGIDALIREDDMRQKYSIEYQDEMDKADPRRYDRAPGDEPNPDAWKLIKPTGDWE